MGYMLELGIEFFIRLAIVISEPLIIEIISTVKNILP